MAHEDPDPSPESLHRRPAGSAPQEDDGALHRELRLQVSRYCPARLRDRVDDIAQIAWLRLDDARRKSERNRLPGPSLIKRVAFCATMDESRRLWRRREVPLEPRGQPTVAAKEDPAQAVFSMEIRHGFRSCLASMSENRSLAVTLYLQGHTAPETGRLLGWSTPKTESLIFRGLADLRRCLAAKGLTP